jgi:hypothetical protein
MKDVFVWIILNDLQNGFDPNELVLYLCIGYWPSRW